LKYLHGPTDSVTIPSPTWKLTASDVDIPTGLGSSLSIPRLTGDIQSNCLKNAIKMYKQQQAGKKEEQRTSERNTERPKEEDGGIWLGTPEYVKKYNCYGGIKLYISGRRTTGHWKTSTARCRRSPYDDDQDS